MGTRPGFRQERRVDLNQKDPTRTSESGETRFLRRPDENNRVQTLTSCLEMLIFEGWNPEGWLFRVECFFAAHGMLEGEKLAAITISLEGEALVWFQWEKGRRSVQN